MVTTNRKNFRPRSIQHKELEVVRESEIVEAMRLFFNDKFGDNSGCYRGSMIRLRNSKKENLGEVEGAIIKMMKERYIDRDIYITIAIPENKAAVISNYSAVGSSNNVLLNYVNKDLSDNILTLKDEFKFIADMRYNFEENVNLEKNRVSYFTTGGDNSVMVFALNLFKVLAALYEVDYRAISLSNEGISAYKEKDKVRLAFSLILSDEDSVSPDSFE